MAVADAYTKALKTWAKWVDANIKNHTRVFFRGYSASHFKYAASFCFLHFVMCLYSDLCGFAEGDSGTQEGAATGRRGQ